MTNNYMKFTKDILLVGIAQVANTLKGFIILPILSKTLGTSSYGIWSLIMTTVLLFLPICLLELQYAMTRFLTGEVDKSSVNKGVSSIFVAILLNTLLISLLITIFAKPVAVLVFGGADAIYFAKITACLIFITTMDQLIFQYFISFRQMMRYSIFMLLQAIGEVLLLTFFVFFGYGLSGAIASLLIIRIIIFIIGGYVLATKNEVKITSPNFSILKYYLRFSLPLIPFTISFWIINSSDRYVIGYLINADAVGIYSACYAMGSLLGLFYSPLAQIILPAITDLYKNNRIPELKNHLKYSFKIFMLFAIPSLFGLTVLSKPLLITFTTPEFAQGYMIIPIVALGILMYHSGNLFSEVLVLFKRTKLMSLVYGLSALINLVMNIFLVPLMGIMGAAVATLITFIIQLIFLYFVSFKLLPFNLDLKFIIKSVLSSAAMSLIVWVLSPSGPIKIAISIGIGAVVYFGFLLLLKGFTKVEYAFVNMAIRSVKKTAVDRQVQKF